jgi:hypothetical protein
MKPCKGPAAVRNWLPSGKPADAGLRVVNPGKLDQAIALVVKQQRRLTGQEVRLLRGLLDTTQASFEE